ETFFFRGVAATIKYKNLEFTHFLSHKSIDANLTEDNFSLISALHQSGLHRTPNEIKARGSVQQSIYGGSLEYKERSFAIGLLGMRTHFNYAFEPSKSNYDQFKFAGDQLDNWSAFYRY